MFFLKIELSHTEVKVQKISILRSNDCYSHTNDATILSLPENND